MKEYKESKGMNTITEKTALHIPEEIDELIEWIRKNKPELKDVDPMLLDSFDIKTATLKDEQTALRPQQPVLPLKKKLIDPYQCDFNDKAKGEIVKLEEVMFEETSSINLHIDGAGIIYKVKDTSRLYFFKIEPMMCRIRISLPTVPKDDELVAAYYTEWKNRISSHSPVPDEIKENIIAWPSYYCLFSQNIFGKHFNGKECIADIPQELFEEATIANRNVYLCIMIKETDKNCSVEAKCFPTSPYLYKRPVASALNNGDTLSESAILPGVVRRGEADGTQTTLSGTFSWTSPDEQINIDKNKIKYAVKSRTARFIYIKRGGLPLQPIEKKEEIEKLHTILTARLTGALAEIIHSEAVPVEKKRELKKLLVISEYDVDIEVPVYNMDNDPVSAFVWQSCGRNTVANASLLDDEKEHHLNKYPRLYDSVSMSSVYADYCSLTLIPGKAAADIVARELVRQPRGKRCLSIDGFLGTLMSGTIGAGDSIIKWENADGYKSYDADPLRDSIYALGSGDEGYLFYDSPVYYGSTFPTAPNGTNYMDELKIGLGIPQGSSGCARLNTILKGFFARLKELNVEVDYIYSDIEQIRLTAQEMNTHKRMGKRETESEDRLKERYTRLFKTPRFQKEIYPELRRRGYIETPGEPLYYVRKHLNGTGKHSNYGISYTRSYAARRNLNIWDAVMQGYKKDLFKKYIWDTVFSYYPNAKCSAFAQIPAAGYLNHAPIFETYLGGTTPFDTRLYGNPTIYGQNYSINRMKQSMDNPSYAVEYRTGFTNLLADVNTTRLAWLSHPTHKVAPFICNHHFWSELVPKSFQSSDKVTEATNKDTLVAMEATNRAKNPDAVISLDYYREMIYHTLLCSPDRLIVYINYNGHKIKDGEHKGQHHTYKQDSPGKTSQQEITESAYLTESYTELQNTLNSFANALADCGAASDDGTKWKPVIDALASEISPFILTGMKVGDSCLWRITFDLYENDELNIQAKTAPEKYGDEEKDEPFGIRFKYRDKVIDFVSGKEVNGAGAPFGYWVKTPKDVKPVIQSADNYFMLHPALNETFKGIPKPYGTHAIVENVNGKWTTITNEQALAKSKNQRMLCIGDGSMIESHPKEVTVFGEYAYHKIWELKLQFTQPIYLKKDVREIVAGIFNNADHPYFKYIYNTATRNAQIMVWDDTAKTHVNEPKIITLGKWYIFRRDEFIIRKNESEDAKETGAFQSRNVLTLYEYVDEKKPLKELFSYDEGEFRCTAKNIRSIAPEPSEDQEHPWHDLSLLSYSSGIPLADGKDHNVSGCIYAESYKIYLAGTNTKLELFRKSDGVNISRVNDYVGVYRDAPVTTYTKDKLLAKFSWLNTANKDREFFITITQYDRNRALVPSNPVWCYKVTAPKGDDGYTLIDLPSINKDTRLLCVQYSDVDVTREPDGVCTGEDHFIPIESVGIPIIRRPPLPKPPLLPRPLPGGTIVVDDDNDGIEALPDYPSVDPPKKEPDHPIDDPEIKPPIEPSFPKPPIPPHLLK